MKLSIYPKLAWSGIRKNRRLYIPYLFTCGGMVMMYYIISFLTYSPLLEQMRGGDIVAAMMALGRGIVVLFSLIFLFYTNSFLIRRRKKEIGLYNILGMGKGNIGLMLLAEALISAVISLAGGLSAGILLSKLAELGLMNVLKQGVGFDLSVSWPAIGQTVTLYCCIFALIYLNTLLQVRTANSVALLRSESAGEKPPKANALLGIAGFLLLCDAYFLAVSIQEPLSALAWFFVAVAMVIVATYLLFIAGSVLLCRILQKSKKFYYQKNHFVSVSSMAYRMKRNGAGLASICILSTMVLVMITGSGCLYFGAEDSLHARYPRDLSVEIKFADTGDLEHAQVFREQIQRILNQNFLEPANVLDYRTASVAGILIDGRVETDVSVLSDSKQVNMDDIRQFYFIPLEDYSLISGEEIVLNQNEVMLYCYRCSYWGGTIRLQDGPEYRIAKVLDRFAVNTGSAAMDVVPSVFCVVPDLSQFLAPAAGLTGPDGEALFGLRWCYSFDLDADSGRECQIMDQIDKSLTMLLSEDTRGVRFYETESLEANREDFYNTYGGLFFLGILLSIVFVSATVLIIYYKQISEGYEDQARFSIMRKVGMTPKDIRSSINSQMRIIFFVPLLTAVMHLAFAFPMVRKLLMLFNLNNLTLLLIVTGICVLVFALFYVLVYRVTSNAYYGIVSGAREE